MLAHLSILGTGHALGSKTVSNTELAVSMGLSPNWFTRRTGIAERRICGDGEDVLTLAVAAVESALKGSGLDRDMLGPETTLLHIQNGMTALAPPAGVLLASALGLKTLRVLSVDGVCAEPVAMFEMASLMLSTNRCSRVIISSSVDFLPVISPDDKGTVGLFGAGAGAAVVERPTDSRGMPAVLRSVQWSTSPDLAGLGSIPLLSHHANAEGVNLQVGFYDMNGSGLARAGMSTIPPLVTRVLEEAGWQRGEVDLIISHQPNARLIDLALDSMGFGRGITPKPVVHLGNMGPASLLVSLSLAREGGLVHPGTKLLLIAFGLGFSSGVAAIDILPDDQPFPP